MSSSTQHSKSVHVVVPCYNSSTTLPTLIQQVESCFASSQEYDLKMTLVDDFSPNPNTWATIAKLSEEYGFVNGIGLSRNVGQQRAVLFALSQVQADYVVTIDDDLEHEPSKILEMIQVLEERQLDVVIAAFTGKGQNHGFVRKLGSQVVRAMSVRILGLPKSIEFSSYRVMRGWVAESASQLRRAVPVVGYRILEVTHRVENLSMPHLRETRAKSQYSFLSLINYFANMAMAHSRLPLRLISFFGMFLSLVSFVGAGIYLCLGLLGVIGVSGFVTLAALSCGIGGVTLLSLGLIGQYQLYLLLIASNEHPAYKSLQV